MPALCFAAIFASGVMIRLVAPSYRAVDLGLEGSLLAGLVGGYVSGLITGVLISVPAMFGGELFTMPLLAGVGALGGLLRNYAAAPEEVWRFSPIIDLSVYRMFSRRHDRWRAAYQIVFLAAIVGAEALRQGLHHFRPRRLFAIWPDWPNPHPLAIVATYVTALFAVSLPLKIWSSARNELKLEEQRRLLLQARMDALSHQINPHFLFNTLNSVSSLIRTNPQQARAVVSSSRTSCAGCCANTRTSPRSERSWNSSATTSPSRSSASARSSGSRRMPTRPRSTAWCPACCSSR